MTLHSKIKLFFILCTLLAVSCHPQGIKGGYRPQFKQENGEEYGLGVDGGLGDKIQPFSGNKEIFPKDKDKSLIPNDPFPKVPFPKDPSPKDPFPKDPFPEEPYPKDPSPKNPYPKEPSPKEPYPKNPAPEEPYSKDPAPEEPYPKDPSPKNPYPKEPFPKEPFPKDPYPKNPEPEEPYPKEPFPKEPFPKDPFPKDPFPKDPFPKDPFPKDPFQEDKFDKGLPKDKNYGQGSSFWDDEKPIDRSDKDYGHDPSKERGFTGLVKSTGNFFKCFSDGHHWLDCFTGKRPASKKEEQFKGEGQKGGY